MTGINQLDPRANWKGAIAIALFVTFVQSALAQDADSRSILKRKFEEIDKQRESEDLAVSQSNPVPAEWPNLSKQGQDQWQTAQAEVVKKLELLAKKREAEDARNGDEWASSLDRLPEGNWKLLTLSADGRTAVFATRRQLMRNDISVRAWFRLEYRLPDGQRSETRRNEYDCSKLAERLISVNAYRELNLRSLDREQSFVVEPQNLRWRPVSPGSIGEAMAEWACKHAPARSKSE